MIVVDTNLLAYLVLPTAPAPLAEAAWTKDSAWIAPALIRSELRNVVLGAVRRGSVRKRDAVQLLEQAREAVTIADALPGDEAVLQLALESGCSAYDCEFVWLARFLGLPLVTSDRQVLNAFPDTAVPLERFAA